MDSYYLASLKRVFGNDNEKYKTILTNNTKKMEVK